MRGATTVGGPVQVSCRRYYEIQSPHVDGVLSKSRLTSDVRTHPTQSSVAGTGHRTSKVSVTVVPVSGSPPHAVLPLSPSRTRSKPPPKSREDPFLRRTPGTEVYCRTGRVSTESCVDPRLSPCNFSESGPGGLLDVSRECTGSPQGVLALGEVGRWWVPKRSVHSSSVWVLRFCNFYFCYRKSSGLRGFCPQKISHVTSEHDLWACV